VAEFNITDFAQKGYSRLLLVEGPDDMDFMFALLGELGLRNSIYLHKVGGFTKFQNELIALLLSAEFQDLRHLGIVRDADFNTDALSSLQSHLQNANNRHPQRKFPVPQQARTVATHNDLQVSIMILPQAGIEGMLENLILDALANDHVLKCVNDYFECLEKTGIEAKRNIIAKAKIRTFLAGKAVDSQATHDESQIWEMRHMFRMDWWTWEHTAFDELKAFLRQLAQ
jgi:hypothetical protein